MNENIFVTKPSLPPLQELLPYLEEIWNKRHLTNDGPFHKQLENELSKELGVPYISLFNNGTNALIVAIRSLELTGEVITTPFTFVATTHSLVWNNLKPIFCDIEANTLNIDPLKIEKLITPQTSAIMPVHCYGYPCNNEVISKIAQKHNLKVIYDAAHAMWVKDSNGSILNYGDLSVLSFHATKVFNTFEGGAIVCKSAEMKKKIDQLKNFGIEDDGGVQRLGMNGKMNEFSAALGLAQIKHVENVTLERKRVDNIYRKKLESIRGIRLLNPSSVKSYNYSYFPLIVENEYFMTRDDLFEKLLSHKIMSRKYFYPLIPDFNYYKNILSDVSLEVARDMASRVLCLPIYPDLTNEQAERIANIVAG